MAVCSRLHHNMCSGEAGWKIGSLGIIIMEEDARKNVNKKKKTAGTEHTAPTLTL
jgi:hypothetical protein